MSVTAPKGGFRSSHKQWSPQLREAVSSHLLELLNDESIGRDGKVRERVSKLAGKDLGTADAWAWMLESYASAHPGNYVRLRNMTGAKVLARKKRYAKLAFKKQDQKLQRAQRTRRVALKKPDDGFYKSEAWRSLRFTALKRADGKCVLCGRSQRDHGVILHVDHIKPRSLYPKLALDGSNLQVLCEDCNLGKSNRDTTDWRPVNVIALPPKGEAA